MLGFWKTTSTAGNIITKEHSLEYRPDLAAEMSGITPLHIVGGLDPAFSTGGDQCVLRFGILGMDTQGNIVLDYRGDKLLFRIKLSATKNVAAEIQIADETIAICKKLGCKIENVCFDANGQGRALSSVIQLRAGTLIPPIKIYSTKQGGGKVNSFDVVIKTAYDLSFEVRQFIERGQIRGLDALSISQLQARKVIVNEKTGKPTLESKDDYRRRMGAINPSLARSPDEMDAAALVLQCAILKFGFSLGQRNNSFQPTTSADAKMVAHLMGQRDAKVRTNVPRVPHATFTSGMEGLVGRNVLGGSVGHSVLKNAPKPFLKK